MKTKFLSKAFYPFILIEGLFFLNLLLDAIFNYLPVNIDNILRYLSIVCCFLWALFLMIKIKDTNKLPLLFSLFLVLIADYFLLFTNNPIGIYAFIAVQITYQFFISRFRLMLPMFVFAALFSGTFHLIFYLLGELSNFNLAQLVPASFYYGCSIFNIFSALLVFKKKELLKTNFLVFLSIILLLLCDTCIGLSNISTLSVFNSLIWLFYLPSQVLIVAYLYKT